MRSTEFQDKLNELLNTGKILPNVKEITDTQEALNLINRAYCTKVEFKTPYQMKVQEFDPPRGHQTHEVCYYPRIWFNGVGMGGVWDGSGVFMCTPSGRDHNARVFTFHFCDHEWDESGANHSRGWHPKRCKKCGVDASIDSGD